MIKINGEWYDLYSNNNHSIDSYFFPEYNIDIAVIDHMDHIHIAKRIEISTIGIYEGHKEKMFKNKKGDIFEGKYWIHLPR